jgi:hypothetical protein
VYVKKESHEATLQSQPKTNTATEKADDQAATELAATSGESEVEEGSDGEIQHAGFALRGVVNINTTSTSTDYLLRVTGWRPMKPPAMPEVRDMSAHQDVRLGYVISRRAERGSSSQPASRALAAGEAIS